MSIEDKIDMLLDDMIWNKYIAHLKSKDGGGVTHFPIREQWIKFKEDYISDRIRRKKI